MTDEKKCTCTRICSFCSAIEGTAHNFGCLETEKPRYICRNGHFFGVDAEGKPKKPTPADTAGEEATLLKNPCEFVGHNFEMVASRSIVNGHIESQKCANCGKDQEITFTVGTSVEDAPAPPEGKSDGG